MFEIKKYSDIDECFKWIDSQATDLLNKAKKNITVNISSENPMSSAQRGALHLWCDITARVLNDAGHSFESMHPIKKIPIERPWDKMLVKEFLYKPTLETFCGKTSTESQDSVEPSIIVNSLNMAFSKHMGVCLPTFPSNQG
jgi:hypothetical protein